MISKSKFVIAAALALTGTLGAGMAQANHADDVQWSVTIGTPMYGQPVYSQPMPVYTHPAPVYRHHVPVVPQHRYHQPTRWDRDGDGIPNRQDRFYNPAWDRDGDGIPNRRDTRYTPPWDRDGDGIPNRQDRHDNVRYDSGDRGYGYDRGYRR